MTSKIANNSAPVNGPQKNVHSLEKRTIGTVHSEVDSVMAGVETREHDAIMTAVKSLVILRVTIAMKLVNASSRRDIDSVVPDPDQVYFSGNIEGF